MKLSAMIMMVVGPIILIKSYNKISFYISFNKFFYMQNEFLYKF